MDRQYRLMIYFAHSTMCMYAKDVVCKEGMTVHDFATANSDLVKRVADEAISIMEYELSHEQLMRACYVYMLACLYPRSVHETEVYQPIK